MFLKDNDQINIVTSNFCLDNDYEHIKIFDLTGNKIKEIYYSYDNNTYFIDSYYDYKKSKIFIISANKDYVISYDYNNLVIYHKYCDNDNKDHYKAIIYDKDEVIKLIESSEDGNIRFWDFHDGKLLKKIKISHSLYNLCLWNKEYIFIGCKNKTIKLLNLKNGKIIKSLSDDNNSIITIKKIIHPIYGECLVTQGYGYNPIKLWINNK